jgi:FlaA1/EpsC-like NDP-sugar epimerase/lipopolysaccharide/colanic/teichoic acid biosynthesis glycosyltransferase
MIKNRSPLSREQPLPRNTLLGRGMDLCIVIISLPVLFPLILLIAGLISLTSFGPAFVRTERVGKDGRRFHLYRFRITQINRTQLNSGRPLLTPIGRLLQRMSLVGLPEVFNVLHGDMSLVGPRPRSSQKIDLKNQEYRDLLQTRPGIISPAQLYYRNENGRVRSPAESTHVLQLELAYLRQQTVGTDLSLLLQANAIAAVGREGLKKILSMRNRHFLLLDLLGFMLIPLVALTIRWQGFAWWPGLNMALLSYCVIAISIKLPLYGFLGLYNRYWSYAGINELMRVLWGVLISTLLTGVIYAALFDFLYAHDLSLYRSLPLIDGLFTTAAVGGSRFLLRGLYYWQHRRHTVWCGQRVLIMGAGEAGITAVREMRANPQLDMLPVAFVDDDPAKLGALIEEIVVLGAVEDIPRLVRQHHIQKIIVAIPSAPLPRQKEILALCAETGTPTDSLPGVYELLAGSKSISPTPRIDYNELLHRKPVKVDLQAVNGRLRDATVLVTGAGGSIGSELCRQLGRCGLRQLILLGHGENSIFEIGLNLRTLYPDLAVQQVIVDVRDKLRVERIVKQYRPDLIFHAAAHKHVPLMEGCVEEAVMNNVWGSWNVIRAADKYGVERFVLISTDKAIQPVNIMGATKRIAELLLLTQARRNGRSFNAVRFGNVLGSRGSVVPIFQRQIAAGGPLTVTHPEMSRYFMTIPEAAQLVLQAAVLEYQGEIFMLDMGKPVRILDLATDLIHRAGFKPGRDIQIIFSGIRPGEKLAENLQMDGEWRRRTRQREIFVIESGRQLQPEVVESEVRRLVELARNMETGQVLAQIQQIIPEYQGYKVALTDDKVEQFAGVTQGD